VTGVVGTANGGTGVNSTSTTANEVLASPNGSTGAPTFRSLVSADIPVAQTTRTICYVAGSDNGAALDTTYSQKSFFVNMIGAMTATSWSCQTNTGTASVTLNRNGSTGNFATTITTCGTTLTTSGTFGTTTLALNDTVDFLINSVTSSPARITVCFAAKVN
jgi:hypothetical protein